MVLYRRDGFYGLFFKKSHIKKGLYLQIYESFYDPDRKQTAHRSYQALGYLDDLVAKGIPDPLSFYQNEVDRLNEERKQQKTQDKVRQTSETTPERFLGYFLLKNINDALGVKKYLDILQITEDFHFSIDQILSSLIYARTVMPCSKTKTFHEVLPCLFEPQNFSLSQLYKGLDFIGQEYQKIIEIYNHQIHSFYSIDTSHTYFDCTNFYFEIDKEDDLRRKGPSKENRKDPIVGLGLLLDANQIPINMKVFPGHQSEKPVIREVIDSLKRTSQVEGRTIQVADKGLNCAQNIVHALRQNDGYIFSKSVKTLPQTEKTWVLLDQDYITIQDTDGDIVYRMKECVDDFPYTIEDEDGKRKIVKLREKRVVTFNPTLAKKKRFEILRQVEKAQSLCASAAKRAEFGDSAKYVTFKSTRNGETTNDKVKTELNTKAVEEDLALAGYNLLVTSEIQMPASQIYSAYHNLWRIEESFRIMKSQLDARPVFLQKESTITGHFLVCYLSVLLLRILQFKILDNQYSSEELLKFIKDFRTMKISDRKYINISRNGDFVKALIDRTGLPLSNYFLSSGDIKKMLSHRFNTMA